MSPNPCILTWPSFSAASALTVTHLGSFVDDRNATVHTFASVALGDAVARTVIVAVAVRVSSGGTTGTVTIAGYSATIDAKTSTHTAAMIARVDLPGSVTSGDIVVTTGTGGCAISVYSMPIVALHHAQTAFNGSWRTDPISTSALNTVSGGAAFGAFGNAGGVATHTWSAGFTRRVKASYETTAEISTTTGAAITPSVTINAGVLFAGLAVAAYKPA